MAGGTVKLGIQLDRASVDQFKAQIANEVKSIPPVKVKVEADGAQAAKAFQETAKAADDLFKTNAALTRQRVKEALQEQAAAAKDKAAADKLAAKEADDLFRTNSALTRQRVAEELKSQAEAAKLKAQADRDAAREADELFRTNAALTKQRVSEELRAQAEAAKELAVAQRAAAKEAEAIARTNAALTKQRVAQDLREQANAAKAAQLAEESLLKAQIARAQAAGDARLTKQLQEELRFRKELASISGKGFGDAETKRLKEFANELNRVNLDKIEKEFGRAKSAADKFFEQLQKGVGQGLGIAAFTSLQGAIAGIVQSIGGAIQGILQGLAGLAAKGINTFADFKGAITSFGSVSGGTKDEVKALSDEAIRLGVATSKGPGEAAKAAVELAKLGFSAKATTKELAGVVSLSEASGKSIEIAAQVVGATTNVFGISAQKIADVTAAVANATAADAEDLLQAVSKAGGVANNTSQDFETLASAFGLLRSNGASAETAATGLKVILTRLAAPGSTGAKAAAAEFEKLGVTIRDQTTGKLRNLIDLIPEFRTALGKVDERDKARLVKDLFGDEGGPAFLGLLSVSQQKIEETVKTIRNSEGNAGATSAKLLQGFDGALKLLSGSVETLGVKFGENLEPGLEAAVRLANDVLVKFLQSDQAFAALNGAAQDFADFLGKNPQIVDELAAGLVQVSDAIGGIAADALTTFIDALEQNPNLIGDFADGTVRFVDALADGIGKALELADAFLTITGYVSKAVEGVQGLIQAIGSIPGDILKRLGLENSPILGIAKQGLGRIADNINPLNPAGKITSAVNLAKDAFSGNVFSGGDEEGAGVKGVSAGRGLVGDVRRSPAESGFSAGANASGGTAGAGLNAFAGSGAGAQRYTTDKDIKKANQEAFQDITKLENQAQASEDRQTANIKRALADRAITREEAQKQLLAAEVAGTQARIAAIEQGLAKIDELEKSGKLSKADADQKRAELSKKQADLEKQLIEQRLKAQEEADKRAIDSFERANQKRLSLIESAQTQELTAIKARQLEGTLGEKDAAIEAQAIATRNAAEVLKAKEVELKGLQALRNRFSDPKEFAQKELAAQREVEQARLRSLEQSLQVDRAKRERAIEVRLAAEKNATQQIVQGYQRQANALDFLVKREELVAKFNEARINREKAGSDAAIASSESQLAAFDKAAEAQKRLTTDKELKGGTKEVLTAIAQDAGIQGKSELDVLKQKQALEDDIAQKKLQALKAEQTQARVLLELDLRRQQIAVDQSVIAAKQAEIQAQQGVAEAEAQLKRAQLTGNQEDIAAAQTGLQGAKDSLGAARDNRRLAEVGKEDFKDLARNAQAAQRIAQESQLGQFNAGEKNRRQDQALALAEAGATGADLQNSIAKFRQPATAVEALPQFSIESFGADIAKSLQGANQPLVDQLAKIGDQLLQAVQTPRSLTVQSPNPVTDASKIVTDMAKGSARARGI